MGNDGGSIPTRRELVKEAAKNPSTTALKESAAEKQDFYWTTDPLSNKPLRPPIVSDCSGKLYSKQSILEYLLPADDDEGKARKVDQEKVIAGTVKSLKDVVEVKFHSEGEENGTEKNGDGAGKERWVCPITSKVLGPGAKAVYLVPCGHAFTADGVKMVKDGQCVTCGERYAENDVIPIIPTKEEDVARLQLRIKSLRERGLTHSLKEAKKTKDKDRKRKHGEENGEKEKKRKRGEANGESNEHRDSERKSKRLPFRARYLDKHDLEDYRALFAEYLDIQKELDIRRLGEREEYGRWKSFVHKWNDGELADGWYDPATRKNAEERYQLSKPKDKHIRPDRRPPPDWKPKAELGVPPEDSDDEFGPAFPSRGAILSKSGPAIPSAQDLQYRDEIREQDRLDERKDIAYHRKQDQKLQKERLDDLVPRAEPGTRERQLEKKREVAASNKAFAGQKSPGAEELGDRDLMGDDGIEAYKRQKREQEKKKTERDIKKEEIWRARAAEREERLAKLREKEEKTMENLRQLAKARFG